MSIFEKAKHLIAEHVPVETREMAAEIMECFGDRPRDKAIDLGLQALKLAAQLHEIGAEPDDALAAVMELERSSNWLPTNAEIIAAVERAQATVPVFLGYTEPNALGYSTIVCSKVKTRAWQRMSDHDRARFIQQQRELKGIHGLPALPPREISQETVNRLAELGIRPEST